MRPHGREHLTGHAQFTVDGLREGSHVLLVRATDVTGAEDPTPATYTWTVRMLVCVVPLACGLSWWKAFIRPDSASVGFAAWIGGAVYTPALGRNQLRYLPWLQLHEPYSLPCELRRST